MIQETIITAELAKFIAGFEFISKSLGSIAYLLDEHQCFVEISLAFSQQFCIKNDKQIIGKNYAKLSLSKLKFYKNNSKNLIKQNQQILLSKHHSVFLEIHEEAKFNNLYIVNKYPLIINEQVLGIYIHMRPFSLQRHSDLVFCSFAKTEYCIKPLNSIHKLTQKQLLVLFLFLRKYSYTDISLWLNVFGCAITPAGVNEHLDNIKIKFGAKNKKELLEKAILAGLPSIMPKGFSDAGSYLIDDYLIQLDAYNNYPLVAQNTANSSVPRNNNSVTINYIGQNEQLIAYLELFKNYYQQTNELAYLFMENGTLLAKTSAYAEIEPEHQILMQQTQIPVSGGHGSYLDIFYINEKPKVYLRELQKISLESGLSIFLINCRPFYTPNIPKIVIDIFRKFSFPKIKIKPSYKITEKQHMVMFFYARNYSVPEIALIMTELGYKMSIATIHEHLDKVKLQLGVKNQRQLIDAALVIAYGLIPSKLLNLGTHSLSDTVIGSWVV